MPGKLNISEKARKARRRASERRYLRENYDKHRKAARRWRENNRDHARKLSREWQAKNRERANEHRLAFLAKNPNYYAERWARRRLRDAWRIWTTQCAAGRRIVAELYPES